MYYYIYIYIYVLLYIYLYITNKEINNQLHTNKMIHDGCKYV